MRTVPNTAWRRRMAAGLALLLVVGLTAIVPATAAEPEPGTLAWGCAFGTRNREPCPKSPTAVEGLDDVVAVSAGGSYGGRAGTGQGDDVHSLALRSDGSVWAWGDNFYGQLGNGTSEASRTPVQVVDPSDPSGFLTGVVAVAAGGIHSMALKADGTVVAWGDNSRGQLGDGAVLEAGPVLFSPKPTPGTYSTTPTQVADPNDPSGFLTGIVALAAGGAHNLAVKTDGTVMAWGFNGEGQLGNGTVVPGSRSDSSGRPCEDCDEDLPGQSHPTPVKDLTGVRAVAGGALHSLALTGEGTMFAWGANASGQIGDGSTTQRATPVQVVDPEDPSGYLTGVAGMAGGLAHSLAVTADGGVRAWGSDGLGRLGNGSAPSESHFSPVPVHVAGLDDDVVAVAAGTLHSLALTASGQVLAWGGNGMGQLGNGSTTNSDVPVSVPDSSGTDAVSAGSNDSIALRAAGPPPPPPEPQPPEPRPGPLDYDLAIAMVDEPDPATAGQPLTYTLTVANNSATVRAAAGVTDILPPGVTFVSATSDEASCSRNGTGEVVCTSLPLVPGQSITIEVVVSPNGPGDIKNTASVYPIEPELVQRGRDTNPADNVASETTTVVGTPSEGPPNTGDPGPLAVTVSIEDTSVVEGSGAGTTDATFNVSLSRSAATTVTVDYATANGNAVAPDDYRALSGTLSFPAGQTTRTAVVKVNQDRLPEADETFRVRLSNPKGEASVADGEALGTIVDDDDPNKPPVLSISGTRVSEGDTGTVPASFPVSLSRPSQRPVTVRYETTEGTANAPGDYTPRSDSLTIPPGQTTGQVDIAVNGDTEPEPDETFGVHLFEPSGATIVQRSATGTIVDDDNDQPPALSVNDVSVNEDESAPTFFTVSLSRASDEAVKVDYDYADGTATSPDDYNGVCGGRPVALEGSRCGLITFPPRETEQVVRAPIVSDPVPEPDEHFFLRLSSPVGASIADGEGKATIVDDDTGPAVSINDVVVTQPPPGSTADAVFEASLSAPWGQPVTVDYATADHSATAPAHYTATQGTATVPPGQTTTPVRVTVNGGTDATATSFLVQLRNPTNSHLGKAEGYGDIVPPGAAGSGATHGKIFVTGKSENATTCTSAPHTVDCTIHFRPTMAAARSFVRKAVAYVTPGTDAPRLLYTPHDGEEEAKLRNAGFLRCTAAPAVAPGCFDVTDFDGDYPGAEDLRTVSFADYDAVVVPSIWTANEYYHHGLTQEGMDILIQRQQELADYLDGDGGIVAFAEGSGQDANITPHSFEFLPVDLEVGPAHPESRAGYGGYRATAAGRAIGLSDADLQGIGFTEHSFRDAAGMDVFEVDEEGRFITMGLPLAPADGTVGDVTVTEADTTPVEATFTLSLNAPLSAPVTVDYATADDTATSPADYTPAGGSVVIDAGDLEETVTVQVNGDIEVERSETFVVNATFTDTATGVTYQSQGTGTILDNDTASREDEDDDGDEGGRDRSGSEPAGELNTGPGGAPAPSPGSQAGVVAGGQAGVAPGGQGAAAPGAQPGAQASAQPGAQSAGQPAGQSSAQGQAGQSSASQSAQAAQAAASPGLMMDAERRSEAQVETVEGDQGDHNTFLASARRPLAPPGATLAAWGGGLGLFALTLGALTRRRTPAPLARNRPGAGGLTAPTRSRRRSQPRHRWDGGS